MSKPNFIGDDNIQMLWEIVVDEGIVQPSSTGDATDVQKKFLGRVYEFNREKSHRYSDLLEMNKSFIENSVDILKDDKRAITQQSPQITQQITQQITSQDIQTERMTGFERDYQKKQAAFDDTMAVKVPVAPTFEDSNKDKPIDSMEALIQKTMQERNYDIQQIQQNTPKQQVEDFLKSRETSIRGETITKHKQPIHSGENSIIKYIKIGSEDIHQHLIEPDILDLPFTPMNSLENTQPSSLKKQISWAESDEYEEDNIRLNISQILPNAYPEQSNITIVPPTITNKSINTSTIFSRLKPIPVPVMSNKVDPVIEKSYTKEQEAMFKEDINNSLLYRIIDLEAELVSTNETVSSLSHTIDSLVEKIDKLCNNAEKNRE
jgi:hypothetical protein